MIMKESVFCCPKCGSRLFYVNNSLKCMPGHSYDVSKFGYVNLLMSQQSADKRHGDDRIMVEARKDFLSRGYYEPLKKEIAAKAAEYSGGVFLDAGCGEGYYSQYIASMLQNTEVCLVDISKDALRFAARKCNGAELAVASVFKLPLSDQSVNLLLSCFAPLCNAEFARVLAPKGHFLRVVPMENHLMELKSAVYDEPYKNDETPKEIEGFTLTGEKEIKYEITLKSREDIMALFKMTPYFYKTSALDQQKLEKLESLTTRVEFLLLDYERI